MQVHTPLANGATRAAAFIHKLEHSPAPDLVLTPLGVRTGARVEAKVIARLDDGGREVFSADEARFLGRCLRAIGAYLEAGQHADQLDCAADEAERRASASYLTYGVGAAAADARRQRFFR